MTEKRPYVQRQRAQRALDTNRRITEAAVALHQEVGPARTRVSEIARRAGVQRVTVYSHFADDRALFAACSAHWRELHPSPNQQRWLEVQDAYQRARTALREVYAWYRGTASMTANVLRDSETIPALRSVVEGGLLRYLDRSAQIIAEPFFAPDLGHERLIRAARAAVDFHFWRSLESLGDLEAAELGAGLVEIAAYRIRQDAIRA